MFAGQRLLRNFAALADGGGVTGTDAPVRPAPPTATGRARRIIPCLDIKGGPEVKGVRFRDLRDGGDPGERAAALFRRFYMKDYTPEEMAPVLEAIRVYHQAHPEALTSSD